MDNYTHYSLSDFYINNYVNTVYKKYSTFQNVIYVDYYWLDLKHSNFDSNLVSFYTTANNDNHGGRYNLIINLPLMFSTNVPYSTDPTEKGASTVHESEIFAIVDPVLNLRPKEGDFVVYKFENGYYGVYNVTNIDKSATMKPSFSKIGMSLSPGISAEKLKKFINGISIFLPQYHYPPHPLTPHGVEHTSSFSGHPAICAHKSSENTPMNSTRYRSTAPRSLCASTTTPSSPSCTTHAILLTLLYPLLH